MPRSPGAAQRLAGLVGALVLFAACVALASAPGPSAAGRRLLEGPILAIANPIGRLTRALWGSGSVWAENRRLKAEVTRLRVDQNVAREIQWENLRLRSLIDFRARAAFGLVPARVIVRSADRAAATAVIDRGSRSGVAMGQAVLSLEGLAGRVVGVDSTIALVRTLEADDSPVSAYVQRTRVEGIVEWRAGPPARFRLKDVPAQADVRSGDQVLSTGYGGVFPRGIPVGTVRHVGLDPTGLVKDIDLEPATGFERLEDLVVLTNLPSPGDSLSVLWLDQFPRVAAARDPRRAGIEP